MKKRELILRPDGCYNVPLTRGLFAIVDAEDADLVGQYNWFASPCSSDSFRAMTTIQSPSLGRQRTVYMHVLLMFGLGHCGRSEQVDHKNHDALDNRRENLRAATYSSNGANRRGWGRAGYKGVYCDHKGGYRARIRKDKICTTIGMFRCPIEAAKAYDAAARELHGEFAMLNFPNERPA